MKEQHGDFNWYELITPDAEASKKFYSGLFNWEFRKGDHEDYELFYHNDLGIGGLLPMTKEMSDTGMPPMWAGYVNVDDVDELVTKVVEKGGQILVPPQDIPNVGRFSYIKDPQGACLYVMRAFSDEASDSFSAYEPKVGHCAWNELVTTNPTDAEKFYGDIMGWQRAETMDMGPAGEYVMLRNGENRDFMFGALMNKPEQVPVSMWSFYFRVKSVDQSIEFIKANGGQVIVGPDALPNGIDFVLWGVDPVGAFFSCIGNK